jgi:hypothetical protein
MNKTKLSVANPANVIDEPTYWVWIQQTQKEEYGVKACVCVARHL